MLSGHSSAVVNVIDIEQGLWRGAETASAQVSLKARMTRLQPAPSTCTPARRCASQHVASARMLTDMHASTSHVHTCSTASSGSPVNKFRCTGARRFESMIVLKATTAGVARLMADHAIAKALHGTCDTIVGRRH